MLEHIFGSRARLKLLQIFLNNPGQKFFVRELSRRLDMPINGVRQQLDNLEEIGVIKQMPGQAESEEGGINEENKSKDKKFYSVNEEFLLYPELKSLFLKMQLLMEDEILKKIEKIGKINLLILTGRLCGLADGLTDLLIVGAINREKLAKIMSQFEKDLGYEVNYTILSPKEYAYRKEVTDRFLYDILDQQHVVLVDKSLEDS
jgi:predicted transcriptional regulator